MELTAWDGANNRGWSREQGMEPEAGDEVDSRGWSREQGMETEAGDGDRSRGWRQKQGMKPTAGDGAGSRGWQGTVPGYHGAPWHLDLPHLGKGCCRRSPSTYTSPGPCWKSDFVADMPRSLGTAHFCFHDRIYFQPIVPVSHRFVTGADGTMLTAPPQQRASPRSRCPKLCRVTETEPAAINHLLQASSDGTQAPCLKWSLQSGTNESAFYRETDLSRRLPAAAM